MRCGSGREPERMLLSSRSRWPGFRRPMRGRIRSERRSHNLVRAPSPRSPNNVRGASGCTAKTRPGCMVRSEPELRCTGLALRTFVRAATAPRRSAPVVLRCSAALPFCRMVADWSPLRRPRRRPRSRRRPPGTPGRRAKNREPPPSRHPSSTSKHPREAGFRSADVGDDACPFPVAARRLRPRQCEACAHSAEPEQEPNPGKGTERVVA